MRKVGLIMLIAALAAMLTASLAFAAGVVGTPHDMTEITTGVGTCSTCHIPHKSTGGGRLWAATMSATGTVVSNLCSSCHNDAGGFGTLLTNAASAATTVYTAQSHGLLVSGTVSLLTALGDRTELILSDLPYTGGVNPPDADDPDEIECTSCHNVHNNATNRPFLRDNIRDLCIQCHAGRSASSGANVILGNWAGFRDANSIASHPVGPNVTGDVTVTGNSPILGATPLISLMRAYEMTGGPTDATDGTFAEGGGLWNLGLHLASSANTPIPGTGNVASEGVVCVSCHAIHGIQDDAMVATMAPVNNLLAVEQSSDTSIDEGEVANGEASVGDGLCEMCHAKNPGGTSFSHPVDDVGYSATGGDLVSAFPSDTTLNGGTEINGNGAAWAWPAGSNVVATIGTISAPNVICESCHTPHAGRTVDKERGDAFAGAKGATAGFILREAYDDICVRCHTGGWNSEHHPVGDMATAAGVGAGRGGANIGDADNNLECNDCHGSNGAHNWGSAGLGLDPDWEPANNARGAADIAGQTNAEMSVTCEKCHYALQGGAQSPTATGTVADAMGIPRGAEFQVNGNGSHMLGDFYGNAADGTVDFANGNDGAAINALTGNWTGGGWSRWGTLIDASADGHMVCESCHELEPDKNQGKLLLKAYLENTVEDTSFLCEGCHGVDGPQNTHPMTGNDVTKTGAVFQNSVSCNLAGTEKVNFLIDAVGTFGGTMGSGNTTYPAADQMNCDSCHQVHDANTQGGTYILDTVAGVAGGAMITWGGTELTNPQHPQANHTADFTVFCDECHWYTLNICPNP